jgi:cell division protein FtsL
VEDKKSNSGPNGITLGMVSVIIMSVSIVLILAMIKIYLSNQIYVESKKVNKIQREVSALKAEKIILKQSVEKLKFKNRVTDTIFVIDGMD